MIKQLNAYLEQKCKKFDHDESACFEQFVDEVVRTQNLIENESLDDRKNFCLRNARKTLDRVRIKKFRNINQIYR